MRKNIIRVGLCAGSYSPAHIGHLNIIEKAEKIFDQVIILQGRNPDKPAPKFDLDCFKNLGKTVEYLPGLLTDYIKKNTELFPELDFTVVRGLRNITDLQVEETQYRYYQDLMPDIKVIYLFCDKEFSHVSSSGIRALEPFNKHLKYLV